MARIIWDADADRIYETGVSKCVLYPKTAANGGYDNGVAWNGITSISESPSGGEPQAIYADDIKYLNLLSNEELGLSIEAYTYPDEFAVCDGSASLLAGLTIGQQKRKEFGLCFKTVVGNAEEGNDYGYKLHIIYGCLAAPAERGHQTINDSPEAMTMSWSVSTTPVSFSITQDNNTVVKTTAQIVIDSSKMDASGLAKLKDLEDILYGTDSGSGTGSGSDPRLPLPAEVFQTLS